MVKHNDTIESLNRFLTQAKKLAKAGFSEKAIAEALGFTEIDRFRAYRSMAYRILKGE